MLDAIIMGEVDFGPATVVVSGGANSEAVTVRVCIMTDGTVTFTPTETVTVTVTVTIFVHCVVDVVLFTAVIGKTENSCDSDDKTDGAVIFGNAPRMLTLLEDDLIMALDGASTTIVVFMYVVCVRVAVIQTELGSGGKEVTPVVAATSGGRDTSVVVVTVAFMTCAEIVGCCVCVVEFRIDASCAIPVDV